MKRRHGKEQDTGRMKGKAVQPETKRKRENTVPTQSSDSDEQFVFKSRKTSTRTDIDEEYDELDNQTLSNDSEGSDMEFRERKKGGSVYFDEKKRPKYETWYRSNLRTTVNELCSVSYLDVHLEEMKKTPVWLMFKAIRSCETRKLVKRCVKYENNIKEIIVSFDRVIEKFVVGRDAISLSCLDVQLIFGLCGGDKPIPIRDPEYKVTRWIKRLFIRDIERLGNRFVLTKHVLYAKLKLVVRDQDHSSVLDAVRLTHLYLMASFLAPNQNASVSPHIAGYLEELDTTCQYNWCGYVVDMLISQIKSTKSLRVGGCTMLLPYWLLEHSRLVRPLTEVCFPRFLKWDTTVLKDKLKKIRLADLHSQYIQPMKLRPTQREGDVLEGLLQHWEKYCRGSNESHDQSGEVRDSEYNSCGTPLDGCRQEADNQDDETQVYPTIDICTGDGHETVDETPVNVRDASTSKHGSKSFRTPVEFRFNTIERAGSSIMNKLHGNRGSGAKVRSSERIHRRSVQEDRDGDRRTAHSVSPEKVDGGFVDARVDFAVSYGESSRQLDLMAAELENTKKIVVQKQKEIDEMNVKMDGMKRSIRDELKDEWETLVASKVEEGRLELQATYSVQLKEKDAVICKLEDDLKHRGELMSEHLSTISLKDGLIKDLEAECAKLKARIAELTAPTMTQLCDDPNYISHIDAIEKLHVVTTEKKNLLKQNAALAETLDIYDAIDNNGEESEQDDKGKEVSKYVSPTSMVRRIKTRSELDDRKAIVVSPQPNTKEIIDLHEGKEDVVKRARSKKMEVVRIDERFEAAKRTDSNIKKAILNYLADGGLGRVVFEGESPLAHVTVRDAIQILHHDRLSEAVIDAWAEVVLTLYEHHTFANSTIVFTSNCWDLISSSGNDLIRNQFIDHRLSCIQDDDVLCFPMNVKKSEGNRKASGDHWTLLVLDLGAMEWYFLNSLRPRRGGANDPSLVGALTVVKYIEMKLRAAFRSSGRFHRIINSSAKKPESIACVQQYPGSLDCGVIICQHIEDIVLRTSRKSGVMSKDKSADFRSKMVSWFVDPTSARVDSSK